MQETDLLLDRIEAGDADAVGELLQVHRPRLRRMVVSRMDQKLANRVDPSDIVQESLADAATRLPDYLENRAIPFYPWLRRLAWQKLIQAHRYHVQAQLRTVQREERYALTPNDASRTQLVDCLVGNLTSPSKVAEKREETKRMQAAIETLTPDEQEVLFLRYVEQLSPQESAQVLGIKSNTFSQRHIRILRKLRQLMK